MAETQHAASLPWESAEEGEACSTAQLAADSAVPTDNSDAALRDLFARTLEGVVASLLISAPELRDEALELGQVLRHDGASRAPTVTSWPSPTSFVAMVVPTVPVPSTPNRTAATSVSFLLGRSCRLATGSCGGRRPAVR